MRFQPRHLLLPALLLLGLGWSLSGVRAPLPAGDEATGVMIVQSLWHDHDLAVNEADLARAGRIWDGGPAGLTLFTNDGGKTLRYGRPLAWPLAALPFYAVLGVRGLTLLNMALFLAMVGAALWHLREETGDARLFAGAFFFASAALAYAFRLEDQTFVMACAFFLLLAWQRLRSLPAWGTRDLAALAGAGVLLGALLVQSPAAAILGLPVLIDLALRRRWQGVLGIALAALLTAGLLASLQRYVTGEWTAFGGDQRQTFQTEFPRESPRDLWTGAPRETRRPASLADGLRLLPRNLLYFAAGRFTGLLPYFPFALFALALYLLGPRDRSRHLLAATVGLCLLGILALHPYDFSGSPGFMGSRYLAALYPAFLFLPGRISVRRSLAIPFAVAGLWTALAVVGSLPRVVPPGFQIQTAASIFRRLPLELTLVPGGRLPGYEARAWGDAVWIVPRSQFFVEESHPHGVWVRGSSRSEVVVVSPRPLSRLAFTVYSLSDDNELILDSGAERFRVRFDSEGKRQGTPVEMAVRPVAEGLGFFPQTTQERFYRIALEVTGGFVPARRDPKSRDPRDLGVFLDFTGEGP